MLGLARGQAFDKVTWARFNDANDPVGWEYSNPVSKTRDNSDWVKDRFRGADDGKHEWIPSSLIHNVIERARGYENWVEGAKWIYAHHWLRTDTAAIIFPPQTGDFAEVLAAWDENNQEAIEQIANTFLGAKLKLSGHVGALYLVDTNIKEDPIEQTVGQGPWHDQLRGFYESHKSGDVDVFVKALKNYTVPDEGEGIVWNGNLKFLPDELKTLANRIKSPYLGSSKKRLADNLEELGEKQRDNAGEISKMFKTQLAKLQAIK